MSSANPTPKVKTGSIAAARLTLKALTYGLLVFFSLLMVMPLLWLVNGSLQPEWQINANPVIWLPRAWLSVNAGSTHRSLNKYLLTVDGQPMQVIQIGLRSYTTVVDAAHLTAFTSAARSELSKPEPIDQGGFKVNVRTWKKAGGGEEKVVAVARDLNNDQNLLVVTAAELQGALFQYPLDVVNQAKSTTLTVSGVDMTAREMPDGKKVVALGPESDLWVMAPPEVASQARMVQAKLLANKEFQAFGQTQLGTYQVTGESDPQRYVTLTQESWQPLLPASVVEQYGVLAQDAQLGAARSTRTVNGINLTTRVYTPPDGGAQREVAILFTNPNESLIADLDHLAELTAGPFTGLVEPGSMEKGSLTYRVKQDFAMPDGSIQAMALVGDMQDMAIILPAAALSTAYDARPAQLTRATVFHIYIDGYKKVLNLQLQGVPFWRFFVNSAYLVLMNMIGFFFSCVLVAYGFARIRAPGKNILFVLLLGTMMVPYTILTLPTYLIFRDLHLLGTMVPLWVRSFFGNAFLIFLLRQFFMTLPYELDEAAYLDGANRFQILTKVILPLSKPALATVGIFTFWWTWNSFLDPLIFTSKQEYYTITLALNSFNQLYGAGTSGYYDRVLAGAVLTLLPMVLLFVFAQRYFIEGIQMQGLKK